MAEGIADVAVQRIETPVPDENAFSVTHMAGLTREIQVRGTVLQAKRQRLGQFAGGVDPAQQQIGGRPAPRLPR